MAAYQAFSDGYGNPQGSLGQELPPSLPPYGSLAERQNQDPEKWHVIFRAFSSTKELDPVKALQTLSELCRLWLRPDLHTKEQILEKLVLEQFLISMPLELQVLVKENNVQSCNDLMVMLINQEKPKKWAIVNIEGQEYLVENSHVQVAEADVSDIDYAKDLFTKSLSLQRKTENQPGIGDMSREQRQKVLSLETIPKQSDLESVRLTQESEKDVKDELEEAILLTSPEPQLPSSPEEPVRTDGELNPQEGIGAEHVDADVPSTHVLETGVSMHRRKRRGSWNPRGAPKRKRDTTFASQEVPLAGAVLLHNEKFSGQIRSNSVPAPSTVGPTGQPVGKAMPRPKPHECKDCKKRFSYKSQLDLHRRSHTGERPFQCTLCPRRFIQASDLQVHQRIHTKEKPYLCEICSKTFTHSSTLRGHQRTHTREKPYQCEVCHTCFGHRGNLNVHMRTHNNVKPYPCPNCNLAFRQLGTFKRHQKIHRNKTAQSPEVTSAQEGN